MRSKIKSIVKWLLLTLLVLGIGGVSALYIFKDRIIQQVIVEVNKSLNVPIQVSKVDLEYFRSFPNVAVGFNDVLLPANTDVTFLEAKRLYAVINPITLIKGNLVIKRIEVVDAKIEIFIDKQNRNNITEIFSNKRTKDNVDIEESIEPGFSLQSILLENIETDYNNTFTGSREQWKIEKLNGRLSLIDDVYSSSISGKVILREMLTANWTSKRNRELELDLNIKYRNSESLLLIQESKVNHEGASFLLNGEIAFRDIPEIDISIDGGDVTFSLITSFLPPKFENILDKYEGSGSIDFNTNIVGQISPSKLPSLEAKLQLSDVNLTDKNFNANIENLNLSAALHFGDIGKISTGSIKINGAKGLLENNEFELNLSVDNFISPKYDGRFKGNIATTWLLANLKFPHYKSGKGNIDVEFSASGRYDKNSRLNEPNLGGSFSLNNISFQWADTIAIDKIDGLVQFEGDNLELTNLQLAWLNSDATINGSMADIRPSWDNPEGNFLLKSDVRSHKLLVEDIVALIDNVPKTSNSSTSSVSNLDLELVCLFDNLSFKKYKGEEVAGEITLQDNLLEIVDLTGKGIGGAMKLNGKLKIMDNKDVYISANVITKGMHLDSLFYVFNNFDQNFITDQNLKGKLYANVFASMYFDSAWRFRRPLLTSMAEVRVVDGELNDFKPIMALSTYIDDRDDNLSNLKFSHLLNHVTIREDTIYIPEMSIHTNVRNIALGGYHTLNQHINYQLAVPIINERVDKDEAFGAVQKSSKGSPNLLFRIKGTTSDYKVNYDLMRATGNVLKLLDITKIFKKKEEIPVDSTFLEDEEFDWKN
jgi:hypothetical protein